MAKQTRRVNVNFSPEIYDDLQRIADDSGKNMSEVLRDAVTLEKFAAETRRSGGRLLVERANGEMRELVIR